MTQMITIAIPFYSNTAYLKKAVESVLAQSSPHYQLIISDDCGPDGDEAKAYVLSLGLAHVRYVRQEKNLGLAGNWNYCLGAANTPLVTLLHADDLLAPNYVERMLLAAESHQDAALLYCNAEIIDQDGAATFSFPDFYKKIVAPKVSGANKVQGDHGLAGLMKGCYIMCPTVCYRTALIGQRRFSQSWKMVLDLDFYAGVLFDGLKIVGVPEALYAYRRHGANQTSILTASLVRFEEEVAVYNAIAQRARTHGWTETARQAERKAIIKKNLLYCMAKDLLALRLRPAAAKIKFLRTIS